MNKNKDNQRGVTMIELIAVIAIMAIIGAILIPQFSSISQRARMKTDVTSVKNVQTQIETFYAEEGRYPGSEEATPNVLPAPNKAILELVQKSYLDPKYLEVTRDTSAPTDVTKISAANLKFQTKGATLVLAETGVKAYTDKASKTYTPEENQLCLAVSEDEFKAYNEENDKKSYWIGEVN